MAYKDLRDFLAQLEAMGELKRIAVPVSPQLEMTEICDRVLRAGGPALLFERPAGHAMPVLANLFGTTRRVALGMGADSVGALRKPPFGLPCDSAPRLALPDSWWMQRARKLR